MKPLASSFEELDEFWQIRPVGSQVNEVSTDPAGERLHFAALPGAALGERSSQFLAVNNAQVTGFRIPQQHRRGAWQRCITRI